MRRLTLLATGGTIASRATPRGRAVALRAADLLRDAAEVGLDPAVRVDARDLPAASSFALDVPGALDIVRAATDAARDSDGVVVTYGTDTTEELAFLLALFHDGPAPIVVTGAQRPADAPGRDGGRNLAAALAWAAAPQARDTGASVVFDGRAWPAIGVRKVDALGLAAFAAPGRGPLATIDETGVRTHIAAVRRPAPLLPSPPADLPRVDVAAIYLGCDAAALDAARAAGARGLVLAGTGAGNAPPAVVEAARALLADGVPVAVASRTGAGAVVGAYAGAGADLARAGAVFAGDLSPWQTRLLLATALAAGGDARGVAAQCRDWLAEAGATARP
ncbi:asparaginase [Actinomadura atramentaria]|uniref:asparaginase n=1 Tax=Actinomadura atramentaria TaxID=1990 RepID=UPI00036709FE|nr:asparaginase domain-containing protein [Actinomadura atramentaria]